VANRCYKCGAAWEAQRKPGFNERCPQCDAFLRCCLNCRLHDPGANNQCLEPQAEWQTDKEKANFCEFFEFRETSALSQPGMGGGESGRDRARAALDALFKKS
jgi:hypothetical protein